MRLSGKLSDYKILFSAYNCYMQNKFQRSKRINMEDMIFSERHLKVSFVFERYTIGFT